MRWSAEYGLVYEYLRLQSDTSIETNGARGGQFVVSTPEVDRVRDPPLDRRVWGRDREAGGHMHEVAAYEKTRVL